MNRTFKPTALLLSLVLLTLTLSSCGASDPAKDFSSKYNLETDFQFALEEHSAGSMHGITEAPVGYYFLSNDFIYYLDKKTMEPMPLCKKPNCLHDKTSADDIAYGNISCEAHFYHAESLFYYDNALYVLADERDDNSYLHPYTLQKISLDGTLLETVCTFQGYPMAFIRHRGTVYYSYKDTAITDKGKINSVSKLMSISLKEHTEKELLTDPLYNPDLSFDKLFAFGKYIYLYDFGFVDDTVEENSENLIEQLLIYDIETGENAIIEKPDIKAHFPTPALCKDGLMFALGYDTNDDRNRQWYKVGTDGKNPEECFRSVSTSCKMFWDGTYYYEDNALEATSENALVAEFTPRTIRVYNEKLEPVDTILFDKVDNNPGSIDFSRTGGYYMNAGSDHIFVWDINGETAHLLCIDKKQIGTGNVTPFIVWKK